MLWSLGSHDEVLCIIKAPPKIELAFKSGAIKAELLRTLFCVFENDAIRSNDQD